MDRIGYLQLDPVRVVERSHLLVLWSRLGCFDPSLLNKLLWDKKQLFLRASRLTTYRRFPTSQGSLRPPGASGSCHPSPRRRCRGHGPQPGSHTQRNEAKIRQISKFPIYSHVRQKGKSSRSPPCVA